MTTSTKSAFGREIRLQELERDDKNSSVNFRKREKGERFISREGQEMLSLEWTSLPLPTRHGHGHEAKMLYHSWVWNRILYQKTTITVHAHENDKQDNQNQGIYHITYLHKK